MNSYTLGFFIIIKSFIVILGKLPESCDNDIYCYGDLLRVVQESEIFDDCKSFVDMKLKETPTTVKKAFTKMMEDTNNSPSKSKVVQFVNRYFSAPGSELVKYTPKDFVVNPKFLQHIADENYRDWARTLHYLWIQLSRKMIKDVEKNPDLYSLTYVPNLVIIPGGRFREFYYWDSYWIILGLLHSEMFKTVKGMLENFLLILNKYKLIPNGGRVYYIRRSQPPFLTPMFKIYYDFTKDKSFIERNLDSLEKEFDFWKEQRTIKVTFNNKTHQMFHYNVNTAGPRPESYREDLETTSKLTDESKKNEMYSELKSACESGWDFSSRWVINNEGTNTGNLKDTKIRSIIPVDLNAFLYWNAVILEKFNRLFSRTDKANKFMRFADKILKSVNEVLWSDEDGCWFDYDSLSNKRRKYFYPSNIVPLFTGCYDKKKSNDIGEKVVKYLHTQGIPSFRGGIPTSLIESGEQWDYPNAWPPLQHMVIVGLNETGSKTAKRLATTFAKTWLTSNYKGFQTTGAMFEKYDADEVGQYGGGGEYVIQSGFGWTNGVCIDLLHRYGTQVKSASSKLYCNPLSSISTTIVFVATCTLYPNMYKI